MIKNIYFILLFWFALAQITLNQQRATNRREYVIKRIEQTNRRTTDLRKVPNFNRPTPNRKSINQNFKFYSRTNPFKDYLKSEQSANNEIVLSHDTYNNDVTNNWNENSWTPPAWKTSAGANGNSESGWQTGGQTSDAWQSQAWNNGWWQSDPWKDPYKRLSIVKVKPEVQEIHAADVLIRENRNSNFGINGFVQFVQFENFMEVNGIICNLPPGKHAFHIHKFGEISGGCHETLGDFNPYNFEHGAPEHKARHLGDLGSIEANATGIAVFRFKDKQIRLQDKVRGIIGRSVVIHEFEDDQTSTQRHGTDDSKLACGVIGISQASNYAHVPMTCNRKN